MNAGSRRIHASGPSAPKRVVILTTGGTIAMRYDDAAGGAVPSLGGADLASVVAAQGRALSTEQVCNLPSAHFTLDTVWSIRERVARLAADPEVDGIVITHGTDVLEETAVLLDLTVDTDKPVIVTGAMRTASDLGSDGPANLAASVSVAASDEARGLGTLVVLNDTVHAARYVTKTHSQTVDAFQSPGWGPLGRLDAGGLHIACRLSRCIVPTAAMEPRVEVLKLTLGGEPACLDSALRRGARGIVLEGLGGGRVPPWWLSAIQEALDSQVAIVVASRCPSGRVGDAYGYVGAFRDLFARGCQAAGCLNGQKARIALMVVLGDQREDQPWIDSWQRLLVSYA